jgi:hypothetical protein
MSQELIPFHVTGPHSIHEGGLTKFIRSPSCECLCIQKAFWLDVCDQEQITIIST